MEDSLARLLGIRGIESRNCPNKGLERNYIYKYFWVWHHTLCKEKLQLFPCFLHGFYKNYLSFPPFSGLQVLPLLTGLLLMSTVLYQVASLSSETKFSGISLGAFWNGMIVISKNHQSQIMRWSFPGRLITEPLIIINLFYFHFKAKTSKHLNSQYFSYFEESKEKNWFDVEIMAL